MLSDDKWDYLLKFSDEVFARCDKISFEELPELEKVFICIWVLKGQVDNGGFEQFYFNSSGDLAVETEVALRQIGAEQTADLVKKANSFFQNGTPPKNRAVREEQLSNLTEPAQTEMGGLNDIFLPR